MPLVSQWKCEVYKLWRELGWFGDWGCWFVYENMWVYYWGEEKRSGATGFFRYGGWSGQNGGFVSGRVKFSDSVSLSNGWKILERETVT